MASSKKIVVSGKECRDRILEAVNFCADIVKSTLGPYGKNVLLEWQGRWPAIINDGVRIANKVTMNFRKGTEVQEATIFALVNACHKTNDDVGDGTTTAITLAQKIVQTCFEKINEGENELLGKKVNVIELKKEVSRWADIVAEELKKDAKPIITKEDLVNVATASVENRELAEKVADMIWTIGKDGFITVEDIYSPEIEWKIIEGLYFFGKYASPFMRNATEKDEAIFEGSQGENAKKVPVLVTNQEILDGNAFLKRAGSSEGILLELGSQGYKQLVIIAPKFGDNAVGGMFTMRKLGFNILAIIGKSLTNEELEDIAVYTGGLFHDVNKGLTIDKAKLENLGFAQKVVAGLDKSAIIGGSGSKEAITKRVEEIKGKIESNKDEDDFFVKKYERRIGSLSGGIGLIRVGAKTDIEREYLLRKLEDAANATKAAYQEGVVKGGGLALKEIAERLEPNILTETLKAPYEQIQANAGGNLEIPDWVVDPVKVTKSALLNAASVASQLITIDTAIVVKERSLVDDIQRMIITDPRFEDPLPPKDAEKYESKP